MAVVLVVAVAVAAAAYVGRGSTNDTSTGAPVEAIDSEAGLVQSEVTTPATAVSTTSTTSTSSTTVPAPATSAPLPTTVPEAVRPAGVPPTTVQLGFYDGEDPPLLPASIDGFEPWEGIRTETVRVFPGPGYSTPMAFNGQMNRCGTAFWVARWRSLNDEVTVQSGLAPYNADVFQYELEPWLMPPESSAGYLSGFICERPVLLFGSSAGASTVVDVVIEWQYYDAVVSTSSESASGPPPATSGADTSSCTSYTYNDSLPLSQCQEGFGVSVFQQSLSRFGVEADGYFGPGTRNAVEQFQSEVGLPVTGVVDAATWAAFGIQLPGSDLNGDGVVDASEMPAS